MWHNFRQWLFIIIKSEDVSISCSVHHRNIDDKYSRREEYRGFTQDFKEKDNYKPDIKIEYVDESGRKLCPKEVRAHVVVLNQSHQTTSSFWNVCVRDVTIPKI